MSISQAQRQRVRGLQQRKWRRKYAAFSVEGYVNVVEILASPFEVLEIYGTEAGFLALRQNEVLIDRLHQIDCITISEKELARLSTQRNPHHLLAVAKMANFRFEDVLPHERILLLDGISDPGNVGTLIRSAEWFGVTALVSTQATADWYTPKVVAAARGSLFRSVHVSLSGEQVQALASTHPLIVADLAGTPMGDFSWPTKGCLVVGNESHGPSELCLGLARGAAQGNGLVVTIPAAQHSSCESLNAGVAGSLLLSSWAAH